MAYTWDSLLESGNEIIDSQHKQLIDAVNKLLQACRAGTGKEELEQTLDFLLAYTERHFADEEALQKEYDYPDYLRHRRTHEEFKLTIQALAEQLRQEGPTVSLVAEVYSCMGDWLISHIKGDDFRLAAYIQLRTTNSALP